MTDEDEKSRRERIQEIRNERESVDDPIMEQLEGVGEDLFGDVEPLEPPTTADPYVQRQTALSNEKSDECAVCWVCKKYYSSHYTYCPHCGRDLTVVEDGKDDG